MTAEIQEHPLRQVQGKSFITLSPVDILVDDDRWEKVFGLFPQIPGGVELGIDNDRLTSALEDIEECDQDWEDAQDRRPDMFFTDSGKTDILIPLIVNDIDLPPMKVLMPFKSLMKNTQCAETGSGSHARGSQSDSVQPAGCFHDLKRDGYKANCRSCLRRFWTKKARELGLLDE